ncbi:MAG TPA: hypothetical protein VNJ51_02620 [Candidatus Dormibacteraeota bacterium]|nr:hypothetical protein [Candidatus Dormibacteraeota bacterium]
MSAKASTVPAPPLPLAFFGAGMLGIGGAALALTCGALGGLALFHLAAVGGFAMIAFGALYQFVPVVSMRPLRALRLGYVHLALALAGTACIVGGFRSGAFSAVQLGGALHLAGALIEGGVLAATLRGGTPVVTARGAALALAGFVAAAGLGIATAEAVVRGRGASALAAAHGAIALGGFFGALIVAVTFRLLRMFERYSLEVRGPSRALAVAGGSVVTAVWPRVGAALLGVAGALFLADLATVARHRNPAYQRETFAYATVSGIAGLAAAILAVAGEMERAAVVALWLFVGTAVVGYLQRIVPFIWWIRRSRREGAQRIPTLGEMNETRLGTAALWAWAAGGVACAVDPLSRVAGGLALTSWLLLAAQLARPFVLPAKSLP